MRIQNPHTQTIGWDRITIKRDGVIVDVDLDTSETDSDTNPDTFETDSDTQQTTPDTNLDTLSTPPNTFSDKSDTTPNTFKDTPNTKKGQLSGKQKDVVNFCSVPRSSREILERVGVKYHSSNIKKYITDLINMNYIERTIPNQPFDSNQKYRKKLKQ